MFIKRQSLKQEKTYLFNKNIMNFRIMGIGKPVILLHGSMTNQPWNGFERLLSKYYQVYLPDLPGFGASETVDNKIHNTDLFTQALTKFIKLYDLEKASIIALSFGTIVAMRAALTGGTKGKLILIGVPTATLGILFKLLSNLPLFLKRILVSTGFGRKIILLPTLRENSGIPKKHAQQFDQEQYEIMLATDSKAIVDPDYYQDIVKNVPQLIKRVKNEVVYIYGENDPQKLNLQKYGRSYTMIPNLRHNIFTEDPNLSLSIIKKYL